MGNGKRHRPLTKTTAELHAERERIIKQKIKKLISESKKAGK